MARERTEQLIHIPVDAIRLEGMLGIPAGAAGVVLFAHGSGSSRLSPRNNFVARLLRDAGLGTLLMDLLTREEDTTYETRFDIDLLTRRLEAATKWLASQTETQDLKLGYFGASTGAAAALQAAAALGPMINAVVSRGGRPDLAWSTLGLVEAPTLLIVGEIDFSVVELNQRAYKELKAEKQLVLVPGATHLFEEPGALEEVAHLASEWFNRYLRAKSSRGP